MSGCGNIRVTVEYLGLLGKMAGTSREQFDLDDRAGVKELLAQVTGRHPEIDSLGHFMIAVNRKRIKDEADAAAHDLEDGDLVSVGVNVIGG